MVPAFPVAHFEGSGFRSTGRNWILKRFRQATLKSVSSSRLLRFWDFEVLDERNWVTSPSGGVFGRTELVLRLGPGHHFEDSGVLKSCERNWVPDLNDPGL
ncbi:unnamed protein product [Rhizophagus irregularis]|nr:unnamed protein product [Rhizophagus irregularis]